MAHSHDGHLVSSALKEPYRLQNPNKPVGNGVKWVHNAMLDSITNEVAKPLLKGNKQRLITVVFLFSIFFAAIEASTQVVSLFLLNRRIETTNRLLETKGLLAPQNHELFAVQAEHIAELKAIQAARLHPATYLSRFLIRFFKGVWPTAPFALLVLYLAYNIIPKTPTEGRLIAVAFGFAAFQVVVVFAVANGLISAYWNTSRSFFESLILFPVLSGVLLSVIIALLLFLQEREAKPKEEAQALNALTKMGQGC